MQSALFVPALGGMGLNSPTITPTGTVMDGSEASSWGSRACASAHSP
jgi:hypothetical protein